VIPNGVDTDYFGRGDIQPSPGTLVFAGGMNWYPNRDAILYFSREIWPLLKKEFPEISLTVVGAQPPRELLELAERDPKIVATGFVDDVRPYFANAEVYICPMRDGGGTRLKILDTLSMRTALVSTTIGCEGIKVTPETNVLIADTPVEFVTQVKRVFQDPELRKRLGREGRKLVEEKYSWEVIGNTLRAVYADLCHRTF
jgi:glycosyltransferase involved in cell wall biosynthesis